MRSTDNIATTSRKRKSKCDEQTVSGRRGGVGGELGRDESSSPALHHSHAPHAYLEEQQRRAISPMPTPLLQEGLHPVVTNNSTTHRRTTRRGIPATETPHGMKKAIPPRLRRRDDDLRQG